MLTVNVFAYLKSSHLIKNKKFMTLFNCKKEQTLGNT